jgi:hypothetical protein
MAAKKEKSEQEVANAISPGVKRKRRRKIDKVEEESEDQGSQDYDRDGDNMRLDTEGILRSPRNRRGLGQKAFGNLKNLRKISSGQRMRLPS